MSNKLVNLFFSKTKEKTSEEKVQELLSSVVKYLPEFRKALREITLGDQTGFANPSDGTLLGELYDFYINAAGGMHNNAVFGNSSVVGGTSVNYTTIPFSVQEWTSEVNALPAVSPVRVNSAGAVITKDPRIDKKPIDVQNELHVPPIPVRMEELDTLIATFKDKTKLLKHNYAQAQIDGIIERLENRKHYKDHVDFFAGFPNTTNEKIEALLAKYKLVIRESDLFVPSFPKEAIDVMTSYSEVVKKISNKKPVYYVIAELSDFEKKEKQLRRDPILLVQSPFGFYWQILGAWDKEILILTEL